MKKILMRIVIVNPPHTSIGSRIPREHLPPLGLLCVGGSLIDAGHEVHLIDAEFGPLPPDEIIKRVQFFSPKAVLMGHSGSTSGHPAVVEISRALKEKWPELKIIYGGVFPTYHWEQILRNEPQIDYIIRGEGEETVLTLVRALESCDPLENLPGIAFRKDSVPIATPQALVIADLDAYRIGWELIDLTCYSYWGGRQAVVIQFSRGCPHSCSYCGQRGFWNHWRHRDPKKLAAELAWLARERGVEVINFADENPTSSKQAWKEFLEALIAENVPLILVGSARADDIVRDADILHLYKKAGFERLLLGIENYDKKTLKAIQKGSSPEMDRAAIQLLRRHGILSMATYAVGFGEETVRDYLAGLKRFIAYDPDQIQMMYITPHSWTLYYENARDRRVIQKDLRKWDYKHQVLASRYLPPWLVLLCVKMIEAIVQLRPRALWRVISNYDPSLGRAMRWYFEIGRKVWFYEIWHFFFSDHHEKPGPTLAEFWKQV